MKIRYKNGAAFDKPGVYCYERGKKLQELDSCPICNFDDDGLYCLPEICHSSSLSYPEKLREKVNGFKAGYMDGYEAGRKAKEQAVVLIKSTQLLHSEDLAHVYNDLVRQKDKGVIMLQPGFEYIGTIPEDADIELIVKKVKEAQHEKD